MKIFALISICIASAISASAVHGQQSSAAQAELFGRGVFSTGLYELPPTFSPDGRTAYFTLSTPAYGRLHIVMESHLREGKWSAPEVASFSGLYSDADPMFSPDGSKLFFLSRRPAPGRAPERRDFDIWYVERSGNGWGEPKHVAAASGPQDEHYVSVASSGALYIASLREDSRGRGDVYRVPFINGVYGEPENLGPAVNSPDHHDTTPYVAPDESYIIFSSFGRPDGRGSQGDLYISTRVNGEWTAARNLGDAVNTIRTEYCPIVSPDGFLYFTSERGFADAPLSARLDTDALNAALTSPGNGLGDVYRISINEVLRLVAN